MPLSLGVQGSMQGPDMDLRAFGFQPGMSGGPPHHVAQQQGQFGIRPFGMQGNQPFRYDSS